MALGRGFRAAPKSRWQQACTHRRCTALSHSHSFLLDTESAPRHLPCSRILGYTLRKRSGHTHAEIGHQNTGGTLQCLLRPRASRASTRRIQSRSNCRAPDSPCRPHMNGTMHYWMRQSSDCMCLLGTAQRFGAHSPPPRMHNSLREGSRRIQSPEAPR